MCDGEEQYVLLDVNWCIVDEQLKVTGHKQEEETTISAFLMILNNIMVSLKLELTHTEHMYMEQNINFPLVH